MTLLKALWAYQIAGIHVGLVAVVLWQTAEFVAGAKVAAVVIEKWMG